MTAPLPQTAPIRYKALDSYRFVAALLVVLFHANADYGLRLERYEPSVVNFGAMVDFFFLLSGFVIAVTYRDRMESGVDYGRFLRARLARVYPLHLLTLAVSCAFFGIAVLAHYDVNHAQNYRLDALPANLLLMHAWGVTNSLTFDGPSWSISAEWLMYLLAPLLFLSARRASMALNIALLAAGALVLTWGFRAAGQGDWTGASYNYGALRALPTFFAGVLIAEGLRGWKPARPVPWAVVHFSFFLVLLGLHFGWPPLVIYALFGAVVASAALAERSSARSVLQTRWMTHLGDASYSLYMVHLLVGLPMLLAARKFGVLGHPGAAIFAAAAAVLSVAVALIVYPTFEMPMRRWLVGVRSPKAQTPATATRAA